MKKITILGIVLVEIGIFMGSYAHWYDFIQFNLLFWGSGIVFVNVIKFLEEVII